MLEAGFYNMDCMDAMREFQDGYFDLAVVDPPYGGANSLAGGGVDSAAGSIGTSSPDRRNMGR